MAICFYYCVRTSSQTLCVNYYLGLDFWWRFRDMPLKQVMEHPVFSLFLVKIYVFYILYCSINTELDV